MGFKNMYQVITIHIKYNVFVSGVIKLCEIVSNIVYMKLIQVYLNFKSNVKNYQDDSKKVLFSSMTTFSF